MKENTTTNWMVDPKHSEIQFKAKHLTISNVAGTFKVFKGSVTTTNEDFSDAEVNVEIDVDSIDTNLEERDGHLKSPLFFNAEKHPKIFLTGVLKKTNDRYTLVGELTMLETKKKMEMEVDFTGVGKDMRSFTRAGFEVRGKVNRKDFGISWSGLTELGGLVVSEEIKLHGDIELIQQTA